MLRRFVISLRASCISLQIPVPTSIMDWIISGLICSPSSILPASRISETCERNSRVCGSTIWNSSSMPRVNRSNILVTSLAFLPQRREGDPEGDPVPRAGRAFPEFFQRVLITFLPGCGHLRIQTAHGMRHSFTLPIRSVPALHERVKPRL